jgi:hypothetical protein
MCVFGGNSGNLNEGANPQGTQLNDTLIMGMGSNSIDTLNCIGDMPKPREDSEMLYDQETHRLMLFGG